MTCSGRGVGQSGQQRSWQKQGGRVLEASIQNNSYSRVNNHHLYLHEGIPGFLTSEDHKRSYSRWRNAFIHHAGRCIVIQRRNVYTILVLPFSTRGRRVSLNPIPWCQSGVHNGDDLLTQKPQVGNAASHAF